MRPTKVIGIILLAAAPAALAGEPMGGAASAPPVEMSVPRDALPPAPPAEDSTEPPPPGLVSIATPRPAEQATTPLAGAIDELRWLLGRWTRGGSRVTARRGPGDRSIVLETAAGRDGAGSSLDVVVPSEDGESMTVYTFPGDGTVPSVTSASYDGASFSFSRGADTIVFERSRASRREDRAADTTFGNAIRFRKDS